MLCEPLKELSSWPINTVSLNVRQFFEFLSNKNKTDSYVWKSNQILSVWTKLLTDFLSFF